MHSANSSFVYGFGGSALASFTTFIPGSQGDEGGSVVSTGATAHPMAEKKTTSSVRDLAQRIGLVMCVIVNDLA